MVEVSFLRTLSNLQWNGLLCLKTSSPHYPKGNAHAEWAVGVIKEIYTKCEDNFLLGLLVHRMTPLLYMRSKLSPAELFFGRRFASNLPVIHNSNPEFIAE